MDIIRNQPFHVSADHTGEDTVSYDLSINGTVVASQPVAALQGGVLTFSNVIVTQVGSYVVTVTAVGPAGSMESDPLPFAVVPAVPGKPTNLRLTVV
jgi:hypothetical protein